MADNVDPFPSETEYPRRPPKATGLDVAKRGNLTISPHHGASPVEGPIGMCGTPITIIPGPSGHFSGLSTCLAAGFSTHHPAHASSPEEEATVAITFNSQPLF